MSPSTRTPSAVLFFYLGANLSLFQFSFLLPRSTGPLLFSSPFILSLDELLLFSPSCFFSSHLIPWINFSGTALPPHWQVLWLKCLLARFKWEADCRFEAREGLLPARRRALKVGGIKAMGDIRNFSPGPATQLTNPLRFSQIHLYQENPGWVMWLTAGTPSHFWPTPPTLSCSAN